MRFMSPMLLCATLAASTAASADDLLGVYFGAGVGQSVLRQDEFQIDAHATGWKLLAGWHPISWLGVELNYDDLGSKSVSYVDIPETPHVSTDAKATALYAVGYLPVPLPWLGVYGKLGADRLTASTTGSNLGCFTGCPVGRVYPNPYVEDSTSTKLAWGIGAEFKFGLPGVRVEYERLDGPQGNNSLLSIAATLNF
jgi:Outer membrane protein beta-barrel domain